jgi:hypothetical protein
LYGEISYCERLVGKKDVRRKVANTMYQDGGDETTSQLTAEDVGRKW